MNFLSQFFYLILYQPLLNILVLLYLYLPGRDLGLAVIVLTILIKAVLSPISFKGLQSQRAMQKLQPKIKEAQEKYKGNRLEQNKILMELYQKEGMSPFSGCLPLLLQLPIIIALYQVFLRGLTVQSLTDNLYGFVPNPGVIEQTFFGIDVTITGFVLIVAFLAGVFQFIQARISLEQSGKKKQKKKGDFASMMQQQMLYLFPLLTVFIIWKFGAVIGLYWLTSTLFSIGEHYVVKARTSKPAV